MTTHRFLQIHFLTQFPASLLNRDDVGLAKRIPFGGTMRTRVSSQCLKRHWRMAEDQWSLSALDVGMSIRSRYTFGERIAPRLKALGISDEMTVAVLLAFKAELLGESKKAKEKKKKGKDATDEVTVNFRDDLKTEQVIILGDAEIEYIVNAAQEIATQAGNIEKVDDTLKEWFTKERRENLKQLQRAAGLDAALFGRMVTSDVLARGDAAVHVAHAFTVHREFTETDYFSAVDDLEQKDGALGSGHIGNTELTSGLFYGYVVIDIPLLISNLGGDEVLAQKTIEHFVHLVATVSPGAKLGSTAPYARAGFLMLERGVNQPRSLSDAFLRAIATKADESITDKALQALASHLQRVDTMYGAEEERAYASYYLTPEIPNAQQMENLQALVDWGSKLEQQEVAIAS